MHNLSKTKLYLHNKPLLVQFIVPDQTYSHIHIDIIGSLIFVCGFRYFLRMIDTFTRWPYVVSIGDITAEKIAQDFVQKSAWNHLTAAGPFVWNALILDRPNYVAKLQKIVYDLRSVQLLKLAQQKIYVPKELNNSSQVFSWEILLRGLYNLHMGVRSSLYRHWKRTLCFAFMIKKSS